MFEKQTWLDAALELADDSVPEKSTTNKNAYMSDESNVKQLSLEEKEMLAVIEEFKNGDSCFIIDSPEKPTTNKNACMSDETNVKQPLEEKEMLAVIEEFKNCGDDANIADTLTMDTELLQLSPDQTDAQPMQFFDMSAGQDFMELDALYPHAFVECDEDLKKTLEELSTIAAKGLAKLKLLINGPEDGKNLALLFIDMAERAVCAGPNLSDMFKQLRENIETAYEASEKPATSQATQTDFVEILEQPTMAAEDSMYNLHSYLAD